MNPEGEGPILFSTTLLRSDEALSYFPRHTSASLPSSSSEPYFSTMNCAEFDKVPAFLSKTFDLVEDPSLDPIISWGSSGATFVVCDPTLFARHVLPRNFKHNNFSTFVRQLNTYLCDKNMVAEGIKCLSQQGFRKIDPDKWEFFHEAFQRGNRHLLKKIQRRKPPQVGGYIVPYSSDSGKAGLEVELERLRKERSMLMQEVVELQQQQRTTLQHAKQVNQRLQSAELIQKQMFSFLARLFKKPAFLTSLQHEKEQRDLGSPKVRRRFFKQHQGQTGISDFFNEGQIVRYQPHWRNVTNSNSSEMYPVSLEEWSEGAENLISDELATVHEVMPTADPMALKSSSFGLEDTKGKNVMSSNNEVLLAEEFVSFSEDLTKETEFPEFSPLGTESIIKQEDKWNTNFNVSGAPSSSGNEPWGNPINYEVPEYGVTNGMSDMWDLITD